MHRTVRSLIEMCLGSSAGQASESRPRALDTSEPRLMGILNVTPDSFSDGGRHLGVGPALEHARIMIREGADIIDVGGESTRPGAAPVSPEEQCRRILPVVHALRGSSPEHVRISVDTQSALVAAAAIRLGADMVNDVSAARADVRMLEVAAGSGATLVLMHMQGTPETMQDRPVYTDAVTEIHDFLWTRCMAAQRAGVAPRQIIVDPGIGFGKRKADNLEILGNLSECVPAGYPVLLGVSRKRFMGSLCHCDTPEELRHATVAMTALGILSGVSLFRVHDVRENRQALDVTHAVLQAKRARERRHAGHGRPLPLPP